MDTFPRSLSITLVPLLLLALLVGGIIEYTVCDEIWSLHRFGGTFANIEGNIQ